MAVGALLVCPSLAAAEVLEFKAELSGAAQVPANPSKGKGSVTASFDTETKKLKWSGTFADLTGQPLASHFHGPAPAAKNGPIAVHITPPASPVAGEALLTEAQAADLVAGLWYVNIHTPSYPGGELRGQVLRVAGK